MSLKPGELLLNGQYRILQQLGRGGFGFVYEAHDTLLGEEVAIKELIPALVGDESMLKRFLGEAKATMRLSNLHIVRTHNVFSERDNYYIVMECMVGGSLEQRLKKQGALAVDEALRIAADVCEGLGHAHQQGLVHCDLKPANILFSANGSAKVADFGIAYMPEHMFTRTWRTPAGFVAGTLPYMSPEQTTGVRDDPRVDVYAVGAVLYRMLTGRTYLDFDEGETPVAHANNVNQIHHQQPEPPSTFNRCIPDWLDAVVIKTLAKQPEQRCADAEVLRAALTERVPGAIAIKPEPKAAPLPRDGSRLVAQEQKTPGSRPPKKRSGPPGWLLPVTGAVALLTVVVLAALGILFAGGTQGDGTSIPTDSQVALATVTQIAVTGATTIEPARAAPSRSTSTLIPTNTSEPMPTDTARPTDTPQPTATDTPRPTDTPEPIDPLTDETLKNAEYQGIYQEPVQLTDGTYEGEPFEEGGASRPRVNITEPSAFGDLNGDGVDDAVALLVENSGGSGVFVYLAAVLNRGGEPENVDTLLLGDRAQVQSLTIAGGQITVTMVTHGPDDPFCCPTQKVEQIYELQANKLVQTAGEVIGSGEVPARAGGVDIDPGGITIDTMGLPYAYQPNLEPGLWL